MSYYHRIALKYIFEENKKGVVTVNMYHDIIKNNVMNNCTPNRMVGGIRKS